VPGHWKIWIITEGNKLVDSEFEKLKKEEIRKKFYYEIPGIWDNLSEDQREDWIRSVYDDFIRNMNSNFEISLKGSSLIGFAYDKKSFEKVLKYLDELNVRGKLKCRKNWCQVCKLYRDDPKQGVIGHVFRITKAQAIKIEQCGNFTWRWERPESDFAKLKGDPLAFWEKIKSSDTKPIFYTRLFSEDEALRRLGMPSS
jgi:hypothetical protein